MLACLPSACVAWPGSDMDPLLTILKRLLDQKVELVIVGGIIEALRPIRPTVLTLEALINAKRAADRPKDRLAVTVLESLRGKLRQLNLPFDEPKTRTPDSDQSPDPPV
jgi:hypothetical protein